MTIRERQLSSMRPANGIVTAARLCESLDGLWTTQVRVSWRPEDWLTVYDYSGSNARTYKSASLAVEHVRSAYRYFGQVILETQRREDSPPKPKRRSDTL
jgi:hypothetical protein